MENAKILERMNIVPAIIPIDLNGAGAGLAGDWVSLRNYARCLVVVLAGDGTAGHDITITLAQATAVAGTGTKALNCLETGRIYSKNHATAFTAITAWTKETQGTADEVWTDAGSGEKVVLMALEIRREDLDVANGFDCIMATLTDPTAGKVGAMLYILTDPDYPAGPTLMKDPLVD